MISSSQNNFLVHCPPATGPDAECCSPSSGLLDVADKSAASAGARSAATRKPAQKYPIKSPMANGVVIINRFIMIIEYSLFLIFVKTLI